MSDITIAEAVAEILLTRLDPPPVPTMTLTVEGVAGDTAVHLSHDGITHLVEAGRLIFWDYAGERSWAIRSVDTTADTATLQTKGLGSLTPPITGLQYGHAAGTLVSTNLMLFEPVRVGHMLVRGDPALFVYALDESAATYATRAKIKTLTMQIQVRRSVLQSDDDPMDENDWTEMQQFATRMDLNRMEDAILRNPHLETSQGPNAQGLGNGTGGADGNKAWGTMVITNDNQQFMGVLNMTVRDRHMIV